MSPVLTSLLGKLRALYDWYKQHKDSAALRWVRRLFSASIIGVCGWFIWQQLANGYQTLSEASLDFNTGYLIAAWACITTATALGAWEWALLVRALGGVMPTPRGLQIALTSNLAKYVPGFIWTYLGKVMGATRAGVAGEVAGLSVILEFAMVHLAGFLLILVALPQSGLGAWSPDARRLATLFITLAVVGFLTSVPRLGRGLVEQLNKAGIARQAWGKINWTGVNGVLIAILLTWPLLVLGFCLLDASLTGAVAWSELPRLTVALAGALLLGQLAVFVPMGLGVREAVFIALMAPARAAPFTVLLALMLRITSLLGEVLTALLAAILAGKPATTPDYY
ncbi:MAG: hypothetical protein JXB35_08150 [Anaerolineae bacterium]|nr:hypothetical protein [Anaerolineae bacterium]